MIKVYRKLNRGDDLIEINSCYIDNNNKNNIICKVNQDNFPLDKDDESRKISYEIYIKTSCGATGFAYNEISVYKHEINYITFSKIVYPSQCTNFEEGTELYVYGNTSNLKGFRETDFNDSLYLIGVNLIDKSDEQKIPLSCHLKLNKNYIYNYKIQMICKVTKTVENIPPPLKLSTTSEIISLESNKLIYNYINPINISTKSEFYNPYYSNLDKYNKTVEVNTKPLILLLIIN